MKVELNEAEHSAVLAGLNLLQLAVLEKALPRIFADVASNGGTHEPLDVTEIDRLCDRINAEEDSFLTVSETPGIGLDGKPDAGCPEARTKPRTKERISW